MHCTIFTDGSDSLDDKERQAAAAGPEADLEEATASSQPASKREDACSVGPTKLVGSRSMEHARILQEAQHRKPGTVPYDLLTHLYAHPCHLGLIQVR